MNIKRILFCFSISILLANSFEIQANSFNYPAHFNEYSAYLRKPNYTSLVVIGAVTTLLYLYKTGRLAAFKKKIAQYRQWPMWNRIARLFNKKIQEPSKKMVDWHQDEFNTRSTNLSEATKKLERINKMHDNALRRLQQLKDHYQSSEMQKKIIFLDPVDSRTPAAE